MTENEQRKAGALLKDGRLRQRLSIAECAKRTHIAQRFLESLEEEKWSALPSESHRLGFLKLYSRFLGVNADEVIELYKKQIAPTVAPKPETSESRSEARAKKAQETAKSSGHPVRSLAPTSIPQLIGFVVVFLVISWALYHSVRPRLLEQTPTPWSHRHAPSAPRLVVTKNAPSAHTVRVKALLDSWVRVTARKELLFEGILPAGTVKEWSGAGPFQFKVANIRAVSIFWNNQPVDLNTGSSGSTNQIRIPPQ